MLCQNFKLKYQVLSKIHFSIFVDKITEFFFPMVATDFSILGKDKQHQSYQQLKSDDLYGLLLSFSL